MWPCPDLLLIDGIKYRHAPSLPRAPEAPACNGKIIKFSWTAEKRQRVQVSAKRANSRSPGAGISIVTDTYAK